MLPTPQDQQTRERFINEINRNFSVIAPAGVGKTTSIVSRVVNIVKNDLLHGTENTRKLVLVTYTVKAAEEMRLRARNDILHLPDAPRALALLNEAFFGTIHSFALRLLRKYGTALGLPSKVEMIENEELVSQLWEAFIRERDQLSEGIPPQIWWRLIRHVPIDDILKVAREFPVINAGKTQPPLPYRSPDLSDLMAVQGKGRAAGNYDKTRLSASRYALADMDEISGPTGDFIPLPEMFGQAKDLTAIYQAAALPLLEWYSEATLYTASRIAVTFQNYLIEKGLLRFDDIIELAARLNQDEQTQKLIRQENLSIILDEAQDTDPDQFGLLLGIVTDWENREPIPGGRFTMVGDPQQAIYGGRANNAFYLEIDRFINNQKTGERLEFVVTFRCARNVIEFVNHTFSHIFCGSGARGEQVPLTPLVSRPAVPEGSIHWHSLNLQFLEGTPPKAAELVRLETEALAHWLANKTPEDFGATDWKDVAVICPRKEWLEQLYHVLRNLGFPVQSFSRKKNLADDPPYAWATALVEIMAQPDHAFEIAGVLREIFGISDDAIARFCRGPELDTTLTVSPLQILHKAEGDCPVAKALNQLHDIRQQIYLLPLREAVDQLFAHLHLQERLTLLYPAIAHHIVKVLSGIVLLAGEAENEKERWLSFSRALKLKLKDQEGDSDILSGHLQLISSHKSKGLQWQSVILPFLNKTAGKANELYPRLAQDSQTGAFRLYLNKEQIDPEFTASRSLKTRHELERLFYVSLTRTKNHLYIIDGCQATGRGEYSFESFFKNAEECNLTYEAFRNANFRGTITHEVGESITSGADDDLDEELTSSDFSEETYETETPLPPLPDFEVPLISPEPFKRVTPSSLAHHTDFEPENKLGHEFDEEASRAVQTGADYGNWWHMTMELFPWHLPGSDLGEFWTQRARHCPLPERGHAEWDRFLKSPLLQTYWKPDYHFHPEAQLFWPLDDGTVYDGIVDLTVYDRKNNRWIVIDWKTDFIPDNDINNLAVRYSPQVGVYKRALEAIYGGTVNTYLYSTRLGKEVEVVI